MLKNLKSLPLLICLSLSTTVWAADKDINSFGDNEISNIKISKLNHSGSIEILNASINDFAIINGQLKAKKTTFSELTINGDAELDRSSVDGNLAINGSIEADSSAFNGPVLIHGHISAESSQFVNTITLHGNQAEFEECSLQKLVIQKNNSNMPQTIYLEDTIVKGDIIFEQGNGIVMIDDDSKIQGSITGGTIKKS